MKLKWIISLMLMVSFTSFSLEIYHTDKLNFGESVRGDRKIILSNINVYVKGKANSDVVIDVPQGVRTKAGIIDMRAKKKQIRLDSKGRGRFILKCELKPIFSSYGRIRDKVELEVRYN